MSSSHKLKENIYVIIGTSLLMSCATPENLEPQVNTKTAETPQWVRIGSHIEKQDSTIIYGLGKAANISNKALAKITATTKARSEVSILLKTYITNIFSDMDVDILDHQLAAPCMKSSLSLISNMEFVEHWRNEATLTTHILAKLIIADKEIIEQYTKCITE